MTPTSLSDGRRRIGGAVADEPAVPGVRGRDPGGHTDVIATACRLAPTNSAARQVSLVLPTGSSLPVPDGAPAGATRARGIALLGPLAP